VSNRDFAAFFAQKLGDKSRHFPVVFDDQNPPVSDG
jgi:hypothetical protein